MSANFRSDNEAPVAPAIMKAIIEANTGTAAAYAEDDFEWQNSRRLALENMRKVNGDVMREHATAALAASMVTSEDPGAL